MDKHGLKQPAMPFNHALIGEALGYPPLAYESFPIKQTDSCGIHYHGIGFACKEQDIDECLQYMYDHYLIPEDLQIGVKILPTKRKEKIRP